MNQQNSRRGCVVGVCFMVLWCGTAFGMGYMALTLGAPIIFPLVAFGMGGFGIVLCITVIKQGRSSDSLTRRTHGDRMTYTGDYVSPYAHDTDKKSYEAPSHCPSCGSAISTDEVDWVAPLKAVCPYCESVMDAVEHS